MLVYVAPDSSRVRIDPTPRYIVLESWNLEYVPHPHSQPHTQDVAPSTMYKHGIPLFRSIFTLLRVLPAWKLARRLRRRVGGNRGGNFSIQLRVDSVDSSVHAGDVMSFGESHPICHLSRLPFPPGVGRARFAISVAALHAATFPLPPSIISGTAND